MVSTLIDLGYKILSAFSSISEFFTSPISNTLSSVGINIPTDALPEWLSFFQTFLESSPIELVLGFLPLVLVWLLIKWLLP